MDDLIAQAIPDALLAFIGAECGLPSGVLRAVQPDDLPEPARQLLVHQRDMTSTLAEFHGGALRVDILQQKRTADFYLREVFLRVVASGAVAEYGVIAIAMDRFSTEQQHAIEAGRAPLGSLLHHFRIPFESAPVCFFAVPPETRAGTRLDGFNHRPSHGRFNQLATPSGDPLAWIMEILPGQPVHE